VAELPNKQKTIGRSAIETWLVTRSFGACQSRKELMRVKTLLILQGVFGLRNLAPKIVLASGLGGTVFFVILGILGYVDMTISGILVGAWIGIAGLIIAYLTLKGEESIAPKEEVRVEPAPAIRIEREDVLRRKGEERIAKETVYFDSVSVGVAPEVLKAVFETQVPKAKEQDIRELVTHGEEIAKLHEDNDYERTEVLLPLIEKLEKMRAKEVAEKNLLLLFSLQLGDAKFHGEEYAEAESFYGSALRYAEELGDSKRIGECLYGLGAAVGMQDQHDKALEYFEKALQLKRIDASTWFNRGVALSHLGRHAEAFRSYDKAIDRREHLIDKGERIFPTWTNLISMIAIASIVSKEDETVKSAVQSISKVYRDAEKDGMNKIIDSSLKEISSKVREEHKEAFKQFMEIINFIKLPPRAVDPFEVPLNVFKYLDIDEIDTLYQLLHEKYGEWIREKLKENKAQFIVVCDQKVVLTSNDPYGPPAEKVKELAEQSGKACYTVGGELPVEEAETGAKWVHLSNGDYYPTIEVYLGSPAWSDEKTLTEEIRVTADFDTGNPNIHVFGQDTYERIGPPVEWCEYRTSYHLGKMYSFYPREVRICVKDEDAKFRCTVTRGQSVRFWDDEARNPFKIANPNRNGFVGRELMLRLPFQITLDPKTHASSVRLITI